MSTQSLDMELAIERANQELSRLCKAASALLAHTEDLSEVIDRLCAELEGTYEHLQDIIDGNVTGVFDPFENYKRLQRDLAEMRQIDERVIAQARGLLARRQVI